MTVLIIYKEKIKMFLLILFGISRVGLVIGFDLKHIRLITVMVLIRRTTHSAIAFQKDQYLIGQIKKSLLLDYTLWVEIIDQKNIRKIFFITLACLSIIPIAVYLYIQKPAYDVIAMSFL